MKTQLKFFIIAIFPFLLMSCNDDDEPAETWISLGEVKEVNDDVVIALDNGQTLIPTYSIGNFEDGERVAVTFSFENEDKDADEFEADVHNIEEVLTKDVVELTPDNEAELGNNAIHVHEDEIWVAGKYLNIYFEYLGSGYVSHFINLATDEENKYDENGRLILTFKHNAYNDYMNYWFPGLVSFDLESLKEGNEASVDFVVRIKDYDQTVLEWEDTYEFDSAKPSSFKIPEIPASENIK